ncbi:MAG: exodeoxyribonuclease VII large subunit [Deferribacteraceae bacterium]|jgi:exodeoxyribonuclease VII large subunit|nr:exodeoxyribonuclease VII large subunit [Deferribacteraceae bacterium]
MQQYQVSELTDQIKKLIDNTFQGNIMVHGEVTESSKSSSGHLYFSLRDDGAKLKCAYFRQTILYGAFIPKNGDKVSVIGELRLYKPEGYYSLSVRKVIYNAEGDFWRKFEETKKKLSALGMFDSATKRSIPAFPRRVALLTSATGAAVKDFIITSKNAGMFFDIDLWSIPVQGKDATVQIVKAITQAGKRTDLYDVLVLTRGGGSLEDLSVFNEESVAVALKKSDVPTISAIGHEQDITICDFTADERVATPTAAAERLSRTPKETKTNIRVLENRLSTLLRWQRESAILKLDKLQAKLQASGAPVLINGAKFRLQKAQLGLLAGLRALSAGYRIRVERLNSSVANLSPLSRVAKFRHKVDFFQSELIKHTRCALTEDMHRLELLNQRLVLTDPERLLEMGYSLVMHDCNIVTSTMDVHLDDELEIKMKGGRVEAFVTGIKKY